MADLSASEGTIADDLAKPLDTIAKIMEPLMGDKVACPVCEKREVCLFFMTLTDLDRHLSLHHVDARIQWGCMHCGRNFPKLHGARCHIPKCSGTSQSNEGAFKCEACPMSFGTQRGLSTHERHAHPAVRNEKRRATEPKTRAQVEHGRQKRWLS